MSTVHHARLERAGTAILEASMTLEEKERTAKRQRRDALDRHYNRILKGGSETTIDDIQPVLTEQFEADSTREPSAYISTVQERYMEAAERDGANKRRAKLEAMELAPHTADDLHARVTALELAIKHPTSDRALKADIAELASILKRLDVAKIFEARIAPLLNVSKRTAERLAAEGRTIWANLFQVALGLDVEPCAAIEYLSTLERSQQIQFAQAVERYKDQWRIEADIAKWARKPKLDHGTLDALPDVLLCNKNIRRELTPMNAEQKAKAIVRMKREAKEAEEKEERQAIAASLADDREQRKQALRSDQRFAVAVSNASRVTKAIQSYLTLTPNERADILSVLGLQAATNQELAS